MNKTTIQMFIASTLLVMVATPGLLAQESGRSHHHHYRLIDLGTFGGPASYFPNGFDGFLNNHGTAAGWAIPSATDIALQTGNQVTRLCRRRFASEVLMKSQGEIEAAICEGISRFEQEYMGRGPKDPGKALTADDVAHAVGMVATQGRQSFISEVHLRPVAKP